MTVKSAIFSQMMRITWKIERNSFQLITIKKNKIKRIKKMLKNKPVNLLKSEEAILMTKNRTEKTSKNKQRECSSSNSEKEWITISELQSGLLE